MTHRMDGVKERRVSLGGVDARLVVFPAGFTEPTRCRKGHTGYVVAGTATLSIDGDAQDVGAGVVLHLPPGTEHRLRTEHGCTLLLFDSVA